MWQRRRGQQLGVSGGSGCKPKHADVKTITKGTLTVASIAYMPSADVVDGKLTGIDGDTVTQIAKNECLKLKVNKVAASGAIPLVQTGRADMVIGDWYRSKEREKVVDITVPIYLDSLGVLSKGGESSLEELKGKKLGDLQGNVWNADFKEIIGDGYKLYQTIDQAIVGPRGRPSRCLDRDGGAGRLPAEPGAA